METTGAASQLCALSESSICYLGHLWRILGYHQSVVRRDSCCCCHKGKRINEFILKGSRQLPDPGVVSLGITEREVDCREPVCSERMGFSHRVVNLPVA